jgi:hypothetical protein
MKILDRLRNRRSLDEPSHPGSAQASSADERRLPLTRLLDGKQVIPQLSGGRSDPPTANGDGPPAMKTEGQRSRLHRLDPAREERNERERLHEEARYSRERLKLIGHGSTEGERSAKASSGSCSGPPRALLHVFAGPTPPERKNQGRPNPERRLPGPAIGRYPRAPPNYPTGRSGSRDLDSRHPVFLHARLGVAHRGHRVDG